MGPTDNAELPEEDPSEFQIFVEQSIGRLLPRYGFNLFTRAPSTFAPVDNIPVTMDYAIGPGDEILISVWGQIDGEHRVEVDRNGSINIPKVGTINVADHIAMLHQGRLVAWGTKHAVTHSEDPIVRRFFSRNLVLSPEGDPRPATLPHIGGARTP